MQAGAVFLEVVLVGVDFGKYEVGDFGQGDYLRVLVLYRRARHPAVVLEQEHVPVAVVLGQFAEPVLVRAAHGIKLLLVEFVEQLAVLAGLDDDFVDSVGVAPPVVFAVLLVAEHSLGLERREQVGKRAGRPVRLRRVNKSRGRRVLFLALAERAKAGAEDFGPARPLVGAQILLGMMTRMSTLAAAYSTRR